MIDLKIVLRRCFENSYRNNYRRRDGRPNLFKSFMIIPFDSDYFEVPMFLYPAFIRNISIKSYLQPIVVNLYKEIELSYKTIDASLRNSFSSNYSFIQLPTKGSEKPYFISLGTIFDTDFNPVMMISWQMRKVYSTNKSELTTTSEFDYQFVQPILRIDSNVIINKSNTVERYIVNKILPSVLSLGEIYCPAIGINDNIIPWDSQDRKPVKVIIDKMPFEIKHPQAPSVSTTNEELLKVALDNIDNLNINY